MFKIKYGKIIGRKTLMLKFKKMKTEHLFDCKLAEILQLSYFSKIVYMNFSYTLSSWENRTTRSTSLVLHLFLYIIICSAYH